MGKTEYPKFVCTDCAIKAGGNMPDGHLATWHMAVCPCCGLIKQVTEPRDFRYPPGLEVNHEYTAVNFVD